MNTKDFQKTLVSSINKHSVNGGNPTEGNVDYPIASVVKMGSDGASYVINGAGQIVFKVASTTLSLGTKAADAGLDVVEGAVNIAGNTLNTGLGVTRTALLEMPTEAANTVVTGASDIGNTGLKTVYNVVGDTATGVNDAVGNVGKTGRDLANTAVTGLNEFGNKTLSGSQRILSGVTNNGEKVAGNFLSRGNRLVTNPIKHAGNAASAIIGTTADLAGHTTNFIVTGAHLVTDGFVRVGNDLVKASVDLGKDSIDFAVGTGQDLLRTGADLGNGIINTFSDVGSSGLHTGVEMVNRTGQGAFELGQTGINTSTSIVKHGVSGVREIANTGFNKGTEIVTIGKNGLNQIGDTMSSGIHNIRNDLEKTGSNITSEFKGGKSMSGVSVLNLNNDSTRMLIPSNFLTSKHVYFVRYHPDGTNMYNYKLNMKGGNINYLKLREINPIWTVNNFKDSMPDNVLIQGKQILNNLISDLKTTQFGGYVEQRVSDKDDYYNEYKNYKLKYLSLKNNA
jgi:hypothetical protein